VERGLERPGTNRGNSRLPPGTLGRDGPDADDSCRRRQGQARRLGPRRLLGSACQQMLQSAEDAQLEAVCVYRLGNPAKTPRR
jgi:hypothetical protein